MSEDDKYNVANLEIAWYIVNSLSLTGQIITIVTYFGLKSRRRKFFAYVAWHALLLLPWTISNYTGRYYAKHPDNPTACRWSALLNILSYVSTMVWSSVIAVVIYVSLKIQKRVAKIKLHYPILTILVGCIFSIIPFFIENAYGILDSTGIQYCWFQHRRGMPTYIFFYPPLAITSIINVYCYFRSIQIVRARATSEASKAFYALLMFPLIQLICNSWSLLYPLAFLLGFHDTTEFRIMYIVFSKGQGLFEFLAYILNKGVRQELKRVWCGGRTEQENTQYQLHRPQKHFDEASIENERSRHSGGMQL